VHESPFKPILTHIGTKHDHDGQMCMKAGFHGSIICARVVALDMAH
jgi:hypothetical protein